MILKKKFTLEIFFSVTDREVNMNKKICFAASSGGHYEQLMMLKPLMEKYESFVITEQTEYSAESKGEKTYYMRQVNRKEKFFFVYYTY